MVMAVSPNSSFMARGDQTGELPSPVKDDALKTLKRDLIAVAQHADDPKYTFAAAGKQRIGDVEANVLKIDADGADATWYLDPRTNLPVRSEYPAIGQTGPITRSIDFSDWKAFDGVNLYTNRTVSENGKVSSKDSIKQWVINPKVDLSMWQKPASSPAATSEQPK
jgi:hypothetical protein